MADTDPNTTPAPHNLTDTIKQAATEAHRENVAHSHVAGDARLTSWLEGFEQTYAPLFADVLAKIAEHPDTPPEARAIFATLANPTHKFDSSLIGIGLAAMLYPFLQAAVAPAVMDTEIAAWDLAPRNPLPAEALATAVLKGVLTQADAAAQARHVGIDTGRFDHLVQIAGQSVGIVEALLLLRRGQITDAEFQSVLEYSNVNPRFYAMAHGLRYAPPPAGEVVAGRLKGHLTDAEYHAKLNDAGIDPVNAEWMRATAGRPYGIEQALHLLNRGEISEARVHEVIAQSDVNTDFAADILHLRVYVPPVRSIMAMLRAGAITDARATELFTENGVRAADIPGYLAEAHHAKATTVRNLTEAQAVRMYGAKFIDRATATAKLTALGYDGATITLLLDFADEAQHERYTNAVITRIHARYVAYKLTDTEAHNALNADKVPAAAISDLMALWKIERDANVHVLTPASIVGAYRRGQIHPLECKQRLFAIGVQPADLAIVVADGFPPSKPNPTAVAAVVNA